MFYEHNRLDSNQPHSQSKYWSKREMQFFLQILEIQPHT